MLAWWGHDRNRIWQHVGIVFFLLIYGVNCESENLVHLWKGEIILVLLTLSIVCLCRTGMNLKILKILNMHLLICVFLNFLVKDWINSLLKEPVQLIFFCPLLGFQKCFYYAFAFNQAVFLYFATVTDEKSAGLQVFWVVERAVRQFVRMKFCNWRQIHNSIMRENPGFAWKH